MKNKSKIAVFASGYGSNLQAFIEACAKPEYPAEIVRVVSDNHGSGALGKAMDQGLPTLYLSPKDFPDKASYEEALIEKLHPDQLEWVVLAGFMRLFSPTFVKAYEGRIINVHPSLLPKYPGLRAIDRAYENNEQKFGVTIHFVDFGMDTGKIIDQRAFDRKPKDTLEEIEKKIHELEHAMYPAALENLIKGRCEAS